MKNVYLILIAISLFVSAGCKKDPPNFTGYVRADDLEPVLSDNNQPVTAGTTYTYAATIDGESDVAIETILADKETIDGREYVVGNMVYQQHNDGSTDALYYYKSGASLYQRENNDGTETDDILYLKEDAEVNQSWNATPFEPASETRATGKLIGKDLVMTVQGKNYSKVSHTHIEIESTLDGTNYTSSGSYDYYVAQGIGIIQKDISLFGSVASLQLTSYTIK